MKPPTHVSNGFSSNSGATAPSLSPMRPSGSPTCWWSVLGQSASLLVLLIALKVLLLDAQADTFFPRHVRYTPDHALAIPALEWVLFTLSMGALVILGRAAQVFRDVSLGRAVLANGLFSIILTGSTFFRATVWDSPAALAAILGKVTWSEAAACWIISLADHWGLTALLIGQIVGLFVLHRTPDRLMLLPVGLFAAAFALGIAPIYPWKLPGLFAATFLVTGHVAVIRPRPSSPWSWMLLPASIPLLLILYNPMTPRVTLFIAHATFVFIGSLIFLVSFRRTALVQRFGLLVPFGTAALVMQTPDFLVGQITFTGYMAGLSAVASQEVLLWLCAGSLLLSARHWPTPLRTITQWLIPILFLLWAGIAAADLFVFRAMGVRLSPDVLEFGDNLFKAKGSILPYLTPTLFVLLALAILFFRYDFHRAGRGEWASVRSSRFHILFLLGALHVLVRTCGFAYLPAATSLPENFLYPLVRQAFSTPPFPPGQEALILHQLQPFPVQVSETEPRNTYNVILVFCESLHVRYLSLYGHPTPTTPRLEAYRSRMRLFKRIHCNFPLSENSFFAMTNGLRSGRTSIGYLAPHIECPSLARILKNEGYHISYYKSGDIEYRGMGNYLRQQPFDRLVDYRTLPNKEKFPGFTWGVHEDCAKEAIIEEIKTHAASDTPFFITYVPVVPHHPFESLIPKEDSLVPTAEDVMSGQLLRIRYQNQIRFMDRVFTDIIAAVDQAGILDRTLIVFAGDHGEALNENGAAGHGFHLFPHLTNVCCFYLEPGRTTYQEDLTPGTLVDVMPTILDVLNIPLPEGHLYQGSSLLSPVRPAYFHILAYVDQALVTPDAYQVLTPEGTIRFYPTQITPLSFESDFTREPTRTDPAPPDFIGRFPLFHAATESFLRTYSQKSGHHPFLRGRN